MDVSFSDFPPVGRRGAISAEKAGVAASCPFRLCGDQWSIDLSCNKHWIKIHLCYKGWSVRLHVLRNTCVSPSLARSLACPPVCM